MTQKQDGGPAFPSEGEGHGNPKYHSPGMSLRDYFAGQVISAVFLNGFEAGDLSPDGTAKLASNWAYMIADAMLSEREKGQ